MSSAYIRMPIFQSSSCHVNEHTTHHVAVKIGDKLSQELALSSTDTYKKSSKLRYDMHSVTTSFDFVLNIFIKQLVTANSADLICAFFNRMASVPYNNSGIHVLLTKCKITSSLASTTKISTHTSHHHNTGLDRVVSQKCQNRIPATPIVP